MVAPNIIDGRLASCELYRLSHRASWPHVVENVVRRPSTLYVFLACTTGTLTYPSLGVEGVRVHVCHYTEGREIIQTHVRLIH